MHRNGKVAVVPGGARSRGRAHAEMREGGWSDDSPAEAFPTTFAPQDRKPTAPGAPEAT